MKPFKQNINMQKISIDKLVPADYNPRKRLTPEDKEYQDIKRSIEEFGYIDPIIVNKDMTIISGHQRYYVLKDMGIPEVLVNVVDMDKVSEKMANIGLNKISGEWDEQQLADVLKELEEDGYDYTLTGFSEEEFQELLDSLEDDLDDEEGGFDGESDGRRQGQPRDHGPAVQCRLRSNRSAAWADRCSWNFKRQHVKAAFSGISDGCISECLRQCDGWWGCVQLCFRQVS